MQLQKRKFDGGDLVINMGPKPIRLAGYLHLRCNQLQAYMLPSADVAEIFHRPMSTIIDSVNKLLKRSNVQCHVGILCGSGFSVAHARRRS